MGPASFENQADPCPVPTAGWGSYFLPASAVEAEQRERLAQGDGFLAALTPSCFTAGCVGIPPSMKKQSLSFSRRSRKATMNLSLHFGMTFLSQVRLAGVKDKITGSRQRLPRQKSLTTDDSPGS